MTKISINVLKINKERLVIGKSGKYLSAVLHENRDGPDQYGNDGFISEDVSKEEREAGTRGAIIGNFKHLGKRQDKPAATKPTPKPPQKEIDEDGQQIPF